MYSAKCFLEVNNGVSGDNRIRQGVPVAYDSIAELILCNVTAVHILVDSGSPYTIIPDELYENLFADIELCDSDISPGGYGGTLIELRGYFQETVQYNARKPEERVYVSNHGATIMGWATQAKLKIILDPSQIQPVLQTTPSVVDEFEAVFDQSNNAPAKHFKHRIQWREESTPVQHKVRNIPLSVQPALSEKIQRLQNGGIIEQSKPRNVFHRSWLLESQMAKYECVSICGMSIRKLSLKHTHCPTSMRC